MICGDNNGQHVNAIIRCDVISFPPKKKLNFIVCSNCSSIIKGLGRFTIVNLLEFVENLMKHMVNLVAFLSNGSNLQISLEYG
jgi:hypothetical protein